MTLHPCKDNKGKPVTIKHPHAPSPIEAWGEADQIASTVPNGPSLPVLHEIPFSAWENCPRDRGDWVTLLKGNEIHEPPFAPKELPPGAGVVVVERDGRVWVVSPTNRYGGYESTFPKGHLTPGLSLQQSAVKEAYEEAGLKVLLTTHLVDVPRSTTFTRYYLGQRVGGDPRQMGWESQAVHLVPQERLHAVLKNPYDKPIVEALRAFPSRKPWSDYVRDWHGVARRACFTIQGFALTHGRWPSRLLVDPETLHHVESQVTPLAFEMLTRQLAPELQLRHTLAVADAEGRLFDYNDVNVKVHPASLPTDPVTTWLWGAVLPESLL